MSEERVLCFELGRLAWGLALHDVREVCEPLPLAAVPTLPPAAVGVAQHRGAALPVLARGALLEAGDAAFPPVRHLVLVGGAGDAAPMLGVPVERLLGIEDVRLRPEPEGALVRARTRRGGAPLRVLDLERLLAHARGLLARAALGEPPA